MESLIQSLNELFHDLSHSSSSIAHKQFGHKTRFLDFKVISCVLHFGQLSIVVADWLQY